MPPEGKCMLAGVAPWDRDTLHFLTLEGARVLMTSLPWASWSSLDISRQGGAGAVSPAGPGGAVPRPASLRPSASPLPCAGAWTGPTCCLAPASEPKARPAGVPLGHPQGAAGRHKGGLHLFRKTFTYYVSSVNWRNLPNYSPFLEDLPKIIVFFTVILMHRHMSYLVKASKWLMQWLMSVWEIMRTDYFNVIICINDFLIYYNSMNTMTVATSLTDYTILTI